MTTLLNISQREDWLSEAASLMVDELKEVWPVRKDLKIRFSMGDKGRATKVLGHTYDRAASSDGYSQIFISPRVDDSMLVLAILMHELIHAIDDNKSGHRGDFAQIARLMGFEGHNLPTIDTSNLQYEFSAARWDSFKQTVKLLGKIPHGKLNDANIKRDTNRNIKVYCPATKECGFKFNTSKTQIAKVLDSHGAITCPNCARDMRH